MLETIATVCEIVMVVCLGASWPFNIVKAYKARTAKGTSLLFMGLIGLGYVAGILCKVFQWIDKGGLSWLAYVAFGFYIINLFMIVTGIVIYFRNKHLDSVRAAATCHDCEVHK